MRAHTHTHNVCNLVLHVQANRILKVYPPFVNFFEMSKETLHRCDKQYPRFHAFLKVSNHISVCAHIQVYECMLHVLSFIVS